MAKQVIDGFFLEQCTVSYSSNGVPMQCEIEVQIKTDEIIALMGPRAAQSIGGTCKDGCVKVVRTGHPVMSKASRSVKGGAHE